MIKSIINWTAGGFFRTLGRILVYIVLGFVISLFVANSGIKLPSWLIMKVDAVTTITPSSYGHKVEWIRETTGGTVVDTQSSNWITGDLTNFCTGGYMCYLKNEWVRITLNTSLDAGRTYTYNFNSWYTTRQTQSWYNSESFYMMASNTGQHSGSSSANIINLSCRAGLEEGTTTKVTWSCSFTPTTPINYIYLRISAPSNYWNETFSSYGCNAGSLVYDNSQTDAINNQTNIIVDQTDIINNNITDSTNQIINGLDGINEANQVCQIVETSSNNFSVDNAELSSNGNSISNNYWAISDWIEVNSNSTIKILRDFNGTGGRNACFYDESKAFISCFNIVSYSVGSTISVPSGAHYFRTSIYKSSNRPQVEIKTCKNGNQALNDTLTDDNVSDSVNKASTWMTDFENLIPENSNLVLIATLPLNLVNSIVNDNYSDLCFTLNNTEACIPSGRIIWNRTGCSIDAPFGCGSKTAFITFFNLVVGGYLAWKLLKSIYFDLHAMINPTQDAISWGVKKL